MDQTERKDGRLFLVAGIWNLFVGTALWLPALFVPGIFAAFGMATPPDFFYLNAFLGIVLACGVGYLIVSMDPGRNRAMIVAGAVGKIVVFVDCVVIFLRQEAGAAILPFGAVDLCFAVLFVRFLLRERAMGRSPPAAGAVE